MYNNLKSGIIRFIFCHFNLAIQVIDEIKKKHFELQPLF